MFGKLRHLLGGKPPAKAPSIDIEKAARDASADIDWNDPATRAGASLYLVLSKQFDLIGKPEGAFPFTPPFATDKARGALLGTAIAVVWAQYGDAERQAVIDATVAAFSLAYGEENGKFYALQALRDAAEGNEEINSASDWAIEDAKSLRDSQSVTTPAAFYLAVAGMI